MNNEKSVDEKETVLTGGNLEVCQRNLKEFSKCGQTKIWKNIYFHEEEDIALPAL